MAEFMAMRIEEVYDEKGVDAAKTKYKGYFVKTRIYKKWRDSVDAILTADGYEDAIVTD